jgi:SAM-dependent methyltransferase
VVSGPVRQRVRVQRLRRYWDRQAGRYDRSMDFLDRHLFGDTRQWVCSRACGRVLEVAIGTGMNLPHYPEVGELVGVEFSPVMLEHARQRAQQLGRPVTLFEGDAQALRFTDDEFDTVVCTFSLCAIPDDRKAVAEMVRVLRPGGLLLLADHVEAAAWPAPHRSGLAGAGIHPDGGGTPPAPSHPPRPGPWAADRGTRPVQARHRGASGRPQAVTPRPTRPPTAHPVATRAAPSVRTFSDNVTRLSEERRGPQACRGVVVQVPRQPAIRVVGAVAGGVVGRPRDR